MGVLATDDFNRADENPLGNGVWTSSFGASDAGKIVSNAVQAVTIGDDCGSTYTGVSWPNDQYGQILLTTFFGGAVDETGVGLALRLADTSNFYRVVMNKNVANNLTFAKIQSGSYSVLTQFTVAAANGDTFKVEVQGTTLKAYINGVQVGSDVADPTTTLAAGDVGLFWSGPTASGTIIDNFEGGDFAPSGPQNQLAWIRA